MSTVRGYHGYRGGYLEYSWDVQYRGDIMIHVGDIMSTIGVFSTVEDKVLFYLSTIRGYHDTCGG